MSFLNRMNHCFVCLFSIFWRKFRCSQKSIHCWQKKGGSSITTTVVSASGLCWNISVSRWRRTFWGRKNKNGNEVLASWVTAELKTRVCFRVATAAAFSAEICLRRERKICFLVICSWLWHPYCNSNIVYMFSSFLPFFFFSSLFLYLLITPYISLFAPR